MNSYRVMAQLSRAQERYDNMQPPEYWQEDPEEEEEETEEEEDDFVEEPPILGEG